MTGWLLDTNVLSELRRPKPDANVVRFVSGEPLDLLHVSVVTFAEIRFGIELVKDASRRMELNDWLANTQQWWRADATSAGVSHGRGLRGGVPPD